jgi:ABC-type antimicrobial peptide transport system permease subunit
MMPVNLKLALRSLNRNRLRTLLTMLGIIIGVAAVLTMVALGTGARSSVQSEVSAAGTNIIYVRSGNYTRGGESVGILSGAGAATTLIPADGDAIAASISGIANISPGNSLRTFIAAGETRVFGRIQGIAPSFAQIYSWNVEPGEMFADSHGEVAVIGSTLAAQLFGADLDPVGMTVSVRNIDYTVVGITDDAAEDHQEVMFVPWQTLQSSLGINHLDSITVAAERAGESSRIADEVKALLRQRHGLITEDNAGDTRSGYLAQQGSAGSIPDDFTVETQAAEALTKGLYTPAAAFALANLPKLDEVTLEEMADTLDRASGTMTILLASIAGASLIVGGIGIMNIMLVSITERTREIGLRMAAGARSGDVAMQFLIESTTLSLIGGIIGLLLGLVSARLIGWSLEWPTSVSIASMALALGIAAAIGLIFGSYPARRASLLDPIDALRTE